MKKTLLIIAIVAVIIVLILVFSRPKSPKGGVWSDNKVTLTITADEPVATSSPAAEIHIDASGSMKPYCSDRDKNNLVETISKIWNLNATATDIYYMGDKKPRKGKVADIIFDPNKPNLPETTFYDFFRKQAADIDTTGKIIYLVTDGIMSEGNLNMNLSLTQLQGEITNSLRGHSNLACAILRYMGEYKGDYWNQKNQRVTSRQCPLLKEEIQRPFYVIVLGQRDALRWLNNQSASALNNPEGTLYMGLHDLDGHNKAGFPKNKSDSMRIEKMSAPVTINLQLPDCLRDIEVQDVKVMNESSQFVPSKKANNLTVEIKNARNKDGFVTVSFIVKNEIPAQWLTLWNTEDDLDGPDTMTTYGLAALVQGMFDGLRDKDKNGDENLLNLKFTYSLK